MATSNVQIEGLKSRFSHVCAVLEEELRTNVGSPRTGLQDLTPTNASSDQEILPDDEGVLSSSYLNGTPVSHFHWWSDPLACLRLPSGNMDAPELLGLAEGVEEILAQNASTEAGGVGEEKTRSNRSRRAEAPLKINTKAILGVLPGGETPRNGRDSRRNIDKVPTNPSVLDRILMVLHRKPIIVVPSGPTKESPTGAERKFYSILHVDNAVEFLDKGRINFEQRGLKDDFGTGRKQFVCRKIGQKHHPVKFNIIDAATTHRFEEADWESVVCVFADGTDWQFKSWPLKNSDDAFQRTCVFYCALKDRPLPRIAQQPLLHLLLFPQMLRHTDGELQRLLWESLTEHLMRPATDLPALSLG